MTVIESSSPPPNVMEYGGKAHCKVGIKISGRYGGTWRATVVDNAFAYEAGDTEGCDATFSFDVNDFALTAFQRVPGGTAEGDPEVIAKFRELFFKI
jgi:hypothetical protein